VVKAAKLGLRRELLVLVSFNPKDLGVKQLASLTPKRCKMDNTIGNSNDLMFDGTLNGNMAAAGKLCAQADRISSGRPVT
jgi:hypothetical protein